MTMFSCTATSQVGLILSSTGVLSLGANPSTLWVSSTSTLSADGLWHRIDVDAGYSSGNGCRVYVDGSLWLTETTNCTSVTPQSVWVVGVQDSTSTDLYYDDMVWYDSALPTSLGDYSLGLLVPTTDEAVGNWKRNDNLTATSEFSAVDNKPPTGTAVTAILAANYIQNGTAGSGVANDNVDLRVQAFSTLSGLTNPAQVMALMPISNDAQQVTTGSPKSANMHARLLSSGVDVTTGSGTASALNVGKTTGKSQLAQSFVATGTIGAVAVYLLSGGGSPDDFVLEIQTDSSGQPSGTRVGVASKIPYTGTAGYKHVPVFAACTNGTTYWVVIRRLGNPDDSNYLPVATNTPSVYSSGQVSSQDISSPGTWTADSTNDLTLTIRGQFVDDQTLDVGLPNGTSGSTTAAAQGAFPAGWGTHAGAASETNGVNSISETPMVRFRRTGTYTRVISLDFLGLYVMWQPLGNPRPVRTVTQQARIRSNLY
jgi:hypothetical protein